MLKIPSLLGMTSKRSENLESWGAGGGCQDKSLRLRERQAADRTTVWFEKRRKNTTGMSLPWVDGEVFEFWQRLTW